MARAEARARCEWSTSGDRHAIAIWHWPTAGQRGRRIVASGWRCGKAVDVIRQLPGSETSGPSRPTPAPPRGDRGMGSMPVRDASEARFGTEPFATRLSSMRGSIRLGSLATVGPRAARASAGP